MNRLCYRLVFNRVRGQLMAVAEIARSHATPGGRRRVRTRAGAGADAGAGLRADAGASLRVDVGIGLPLLLASSILLPLTTHAQVIPDRSVTANQQAIVLAAPNGVPLVNIRNPTAGGVSHNVYTRFDVPIAGTILNNATRDTRTELGGWILANPLLDKNARVIVNEVNSNHPSLLNGHVEIAGSRAQLVIANPSGISCQGCGFINADRSTLTTGKPRYADGQLAGYEVRQGTITVRGAGLNANGTGYVELIARAVKINGALWGKYLSVVTGSNDVDAASLKATPVRAGDGIDKPDFAIDVSQLGGMYANKIWLVGTEAGVGVRHSGYLGSAEELHLSSAGRLEVRGTIASEGRLEINTAAGLEHHGALHAKGSARLQVGGQLDNDGGWMGAGQTLSVTAARINNAADGSFNAPGLSLTATDDHALINRGLIEGGQVLLTSYTIKNLGTGRIYGDQLALDAGIVVNEAKAGKAPVIAARERLDIATDQLTNRDGALIASDGDIVIGGSLDAHRDHLTARHKSKHDRGCRHCQSNK